MSKEEITLTLEKRDVVGKGLNALRNSGHIPGVIHQPGKESINVSGSFGEMTKVYSAAGKHHPVTVSYDGTSLLTIIKDADFSPKKHTLRHIVFGVLDKNEKVETEVPVVLVGDAPALKVGLSVHQATETVTIEALPSNLVDSIEISVETLTEVGDKIFVDDIKAPNGVTILTDPELQIAAVEAPREQVEEVVEEAVVAETAETETAEKAE